MDKEYTVIEIADMVGVCLATVRSWIHNGKLKATKTSNYDGFRVKESDLDEFLRAHPKYKIIGGPARRRRINDEQKEKLTNDFFEKWNDTLVAFQNLKRFYEKELSR